MNLILLFALAVAPGLAIAFYIYERDKLDKEPMRLLIISFLLGAVSVIPAMVIEETAEFIGILNTGEFLRSAPYALMVGFTEELCKYSFLMIFAFPKKDFNEPFDGITYGVMVAMGFATLENIFYIMFDQDEPYKTALFRMFSAVPAHACFGILMGYYIGLAKFKQVKSYTLKITAIVIAGLFHAAYDFFILIHQIPSLAVGAVVALVIAIRLSLKAIRIHHHNSPFFKE